MKSNDKSFFIDGRILYIMRNYICYYRRISVNKAFYTVNRSLLAKHDLLSSEITSNADRAICSRIHSSRSSSFSSTNSILSDALSSMSIHFPRSHRTGVNRSILNCLLCISDDARYHCYP